MSVLTVNGPDTARGPSGPVAASEIRFTLLGPLEMLHDGVDHAPTAPKVLQLAALLVLSPGRTVPLDEIVDELWGERPPRSVRTTVQTYVYQLRRCISEIGPTPDAGTVLATRAPGYVLRIRPEQVDVTAFRVLHRTGRAELLAGRPTHAARTLRAALDAGPGHPLANVACGPVLARHVLELRELQRDARHLRIEADLARGEHRELVAELRALAAAELLDEDVHGQLIRALAGCGRRSEAMAAFRGLRTRLVTELGVEPGAALQTLHLSLLSDRDQPDTTSSGRGVDDVS